MKHKRILGLLLSFIFVFSSVLPIENTYAYQNQAETSQGQPAGEMENDLSVKGTNSFGNLLSDTLMEKSEEQQENNGCNIFSIEMDNNTAKVSFETLKDCTLIVGVYDETGVKMLASGSMEVFAGETEAFVDIETEEMPQYYYLRGFLAETDTLRPLADSFESSMYTQEMQEFLAKTTDDFDEDKVLNLDEDKTNNFAVYSENTIQIKQNERSNEVVSADEENNTYVIENADSSITSLKNGDIFSYEYGEGEFLIVKVGTIEINGTTATITGAETSMEEVFDYVKIDGEASTADAQVDASNLEEGVSYNGLVEYDEEENQTHAAWDGSEKESYALSYSFLDKKLAGSDNVNVKLSGGLELKLESSIKFYISLSYQYLEMKLDYSGKLNLSLSGKAEGKIPLAFIGISPIPGVIIELTPSFVVKISAKLDFSGKLTGTIGFCVSSDAGIRNLTSSPSLKGEIKGEVTLFAGLSLEPKVKIISDKVAKVGFDATVGGEVKGTLVLAGPSSSSKIHDCRQCIDGDISAKADFKFEVSLLNLKQLTFTYQNGISIKLFDFYYSFDNNEFAFTACPHYKYKTAITIADKSGEKIESVKITAPFSVNKNGANQTVTNAKDFVEADSITTGKDGKAVGYLPAGSYTLKISADGYQTASKKITIADKGKDILLKLESKAESGDDPINQTPSPSDSNNVKSVSLGNYYSAAVTEDGKLYMWGDNSDGELGNGSSENSNVPVEVMENVKSVGLGGDHSAAVTEDGKLYMWGHNSDGQLGNGTTVDSVVPIKVMENVKSVSLGGDHSAAVTEDGKLYMWGWNLSGQLGNGTTADSVVPIKVMENVKSVSLGYYHSAAVTEDGKLYMWGWNMYGQLGNGSDVRSNVPLEIMENVKSVSLGEDHSAAVTEDGKLYMWGDNSVGELGNGSNENSNVPLEVMENVKSVSLGGRHSAAVTEDGKLYMWGDNFAGQLGNGSIEDSNVPLEVMENVKSVSLRWAHSAAVTEDEKLYMWGYNGDGQLGNGSYEDSNVPIKINIPAASPKANTFCAKAFPSVTDISASNNESALYTEFAAVGYSDTETETVTFNDLVPNDTYNLYIVKSVTAENLLAPDNLLYINQAVADSSGILKLSYEQREVYEDAVVFVVGATRRDLSKAKIEIPDLTYTGEEQIVNLKITYKGTQLTEGKDYELTDGFLATEAGDYKVTITGIGIYTGEVQCSYRMVGDNDNISVLMGDLDGDKKVNLNDAKIALKGAVGIITLTAEQNKAADMNNDKKVNLNDAKIVLRVAVGIA